MEKQINLNMTITYDEEKETINGYEFCGEYTVGEVAVIIATFKHCLRDWGYRVQLDEEAI